MILGVSSGNLSALYRQQATDYSKVLEQIASGRRFTKPSDDFASFTKMRTAEADVLAYQRVNDDLIKAKEAGSFVSSVGNEILDALQKMKGLEATDITARAKDLADTLAKNPQAAVSVALTPTAPTTNALTLDVTTSDLAAKLTALTTAPDATKLNEAITAAQAYSSAGDNFNNSIDRQLTINQNVIAAKENSASAIGAIDEVSAISKATALQVRQQATISMASQANLSQLSLARLFQ